MQQQASPAQVSAVSGSPTPSSLSSTRSFSNALFQKINGARIKATSKIPGIRRNKPQAESPRNAPASKRSSQASTHRVLTGDDLYSGRPDLVLGTLDVALVKGKDLQAKEPFVEIHLENHRRRSSHASVDKNSGTVEWEDARWSLEVTDLASDLHVVLFASHQFRTPQPLGRVIEKSLSASEMSDEGDKSSVTSQEQILRAEYEFEANPSTMYVIPRLSEVQGDMALWALLRNFRFLLKRNKMRIRRLKSMAPLLSYFFSAHGPLAMLMIIWAYTCLLSPRALWPWIMLILLTVNGMMSARDWEFRQRDAYVVWESDVDAKENADVRLRRMLVMLTKINIKVHRALNVIERIPTAWNWSDPLVTRLAYIMAVPTCFLASLVLAFVPLHFTVFVIGSGVILKIFRRQERKRRNAAARLGVERERRRSIDLDSEDSDLEAFDDSPVAAERSGDLSGRSGVGRQVRKAAIMVRNFFWMIPDDYELGHRYVANTQRVGVGGAAKKVSTDFRVNQQI
ncbi:hypothetical protein FOZ63_006086 [Perkinsus olseni]|uniref:Uncharacterized protein n=1 Tax=Perkinsus olseni TaxID=32597 RepID=A0A7J6QGN1_PEROL|nr:hypothetical protein FOZ63_006086 [Perkinsus olseni]